MDAASVGQFTIPVFIGTIVNWGLLGTLAVQVYIYFVAFPGDPRSTKTIVALIVIAEVLQTLGDSRDTLRSFGTEWGNPDVLDEVGWAWFSVPILGSLIACMGQLFFARRIYLVSKGLCVPAVIAVITVVQFGAGIWTGVDIVQAKRFSLLVFRLFRPPVVWLSATALSDLLIVGATAFYLNKARPKPGFNHTTDVTVSRIIKLSVETGLFCALSALAVLALFVAYDGNNYHLGVCIWLSKVYSNSIMVILNSRAQIAHRGTALGSTVPTSRSTAPDGALCSSGAQDSVRVDIETTKSGDWSTICQSEPDGKSDPEVV
ncbi:hypothetical protein GGX14DRAFT_118532 [Mycena pura]|uniref:DUF6534 domain-containing protein n=1 Tax=Mycena pura TaxID=153505 RepID=A0AAD6VA92_9AGAR|nr:hypothetical protein GGX14DRAFT_118532 [Mycena pura]